MKKYFQSYIKKYQILPKRSLYDDYAKNLITDFNRHEATLYFIVKTKKVVFLPETFRAVENYCFVGNLEVAGKKHEIIFNAAKMHFENSEIREKFDSTEDFCNFSMDVFRFKDYPDLSNDEKYALISQVVLDESSPNQLVIDCPLTKRISGVGTKIVFTPYQLIMMFDIDCLDKLEVLYVGKSNDDTWRRIYNHNKWGNIGENIFDDEEAIVYFLQLDKSDVSVGEVEGGITLICRQESDVTIEDATLAIEAAMISYFIKEKKFNDHHVGKRVEEIKLIGEKLTNNGYTDLVVEIILEGFFGYLGTDKVGFGNNHKIEAAI